MADGAVREQPFTGHQVRAFRAAFAARDLVDGSMLPVVHAGCLDEVLEDLFRVALEVVVIRVVAVIERYGFTLRAERDAAGSIVLRVRAKIEVRLHAVTENGRDVRRHLRLVLLRLALLWFVLLRLALLWFVLLRRVLFQLGFAGCALRIVSH